MWQEMIDTKYEKNTIQKLTANYDKFIKVGSIDEIKRNFMLHESKDPKDKKLVD